MNVKEHICKSGKASNLNEDYLLYRDNSFVLVLDGTTGLSTTQLPAGSKYHTWAQWYVHRVGELVLQKIQQAEDIRQMMKECISILREEYITMVPQDHLLSEEERRILEPSASLALLWETERYVELLTLGDLSVLLKYADGQVRQIYDNSVEKLDHEVIQLLVDISKEEQISVRDAMNVAEVQKKLKENRLKKNSGDENGYWILGLEESALDHAEWHRWKKDCDEIPASMIICSDGFSAYYEKYMSRTIKKGEETKTFFNKAENIGLKRLYKELRKVEHGDQACTQYPRFKQSDDATAVWIKLDKWSTWWNVKIHRLLGRCQSMCMTIGVSKSVVVTLVTALATIIYYCLLILNDSKEDHPFNTLANTGMIATTAYTIIDSVISYRKWEKGIRILSDMSYKNEIRKIWRLNRVETEDGFEIKSFYNGKSNEYFIESDEFNRQLQAGKQIEYKDINYHYKLPEEIKRLVPRIMETTFHKPGIVFNGTLLRQSSHIGLHNNTVFVQKAGYFDGQCSHEIVYKQFFSPEQIDVFFEGKRLLVSDEGAIHDLGHSSCANFLGASTLVITRDHYLLIGKQGFFSKANKGRYAPSGSGSVDYADIRRACKYYEKTKKDLMFNDILTFAMEREFSEECNYELKKLKCTMKTALVGYVRLLERGGKPDYFGISYMNEDIAQDERKDSNAIRKSEYGLMDGIEQISFQRWEEIPDILEEFVKEHRENGKISIQLYLLMGYLKDMKAQGILEDKLKELGCEL